MQTKEMEFQFECVEAGRRVLRAVRLFQRNPLTALEAVRKLSVVPNFLDRSNPVSTLYRSDVILFEVDDVGMLAVGDMQYGFSASVHITFWDRRLRGREELCRKMAEWVIAIAGLKYVWTVIPEETRATLAFAKRLGFVVEKIENGVVLLTFARRD